MKVQKLAVFLKTTSAKKEFAANLGISLVAVYNYISGRRRPNQKIMKNIVKITNGYIQPNDFYNTPTTIHEAIQLSNKEVKG